MNYNFFFYINQFSFFKSNYDNPCEFLSAFKTSGTCPPQLTSHGLPCTCPFNPSTIDLPPSVFEVAQINAAWQWLATVSHQMYISIAKRYSAMPIVNINFLSPIFPILKNAIFNKT